MKMLGRWDYSRPAPVYGTLASYERAAAWLDGVCPVVEDWGCGAAAAKPYFKKSRYVGVDGSGGHADVVADLREYTSAVDGILIRHVLEHNYDWPLVLENAIRSCRRLTIVFFLKLEDYTTVSSINPDGVPNLHVSRIVLEHMLGKSGMAFTTVTVPRNDTSPHKSEWLYLCGAR